MKKWLKIVLVVIAALVVLTMCFGGGDDNASETTTDTSKETEVVESADETETTETADKTEKPVVESEPDLTTDEGKTAWVESYFDQYVNKSGHFGTLDHVDINADAGEGEGYIMLVYCSFDMQNKADTAKQTISMIAEDMAARCGQELSDVNELCIFWDVPYLNSNAKTQFERKNGGMAIGDQVYNF